MVSILMYRVWVYPYPRWRLELGNMIVGDAPIYMFINIINILEVEYRYIIIHIM